ncbi:MAG: M1 family aminopeptidase [Bacteroidota bacterium]|nr:M1 family aminopeptidase [Bacteroidota bacterium]
MKNSLLSILVLLSLFAKAQQHHCAKAKQAALKNQIQFQARTSSLLPQISHELKYDVKFVHLNLNLERTNKNVSGGVTTVATVTIAPLDTFQTLLHQNHTIDSVRLNGLLLSSIRQDSLIKVKIPTPLTTGTTFTVTVYYHGIAPVGGSAIGNGFSNGTSGSWGNQVTWSLSESLAGYHWWPCKQILTDKIDSSWVFVTTDSTNKVGSNGILKNTVVVGNKKRYEWKSKTPIAYYLISVAIAKYKEYNLYAHPLYLPGDSILIQNYIYDNALNNTLFNSQKLTLNKMPQVMELQCKLFGMYPFYKEKYGHCMAPFGGGMEHQTMTSLGFFDYYVDAHELGHQWWGDNVTCKSWGDIWINEGFASYSEHLTAQYLDPTNFAPNLTSAHTNVMSQPGGSCYFTNHDTVDANRIFDSRLTYDKGGAIIRTLQFVTNNDSVWFNTLRGFQNTYKNSTASVVDFMNYYQSQTSINPTQFFNQWYYGQGYPTFTVKYNQVGNTCYIKSTQSTSTPTSVPLYVTPMEYKITRSGAPDTTVRVLHSNTIENYSFNILGTVTGMVCDPNNWVINKVVGPSLDVTLTSINQIDKNASTITLGPNPTKGGITIYNIPSEVKSLQVFDVAGKNIFNQKCDKEGNIDLSQLSNGIYFIKLYNEDRIEVYSQKIIKE